MSSELSPLLNSKETTPLMEEIYSIVIHGKRAPSSTTLERTEKLCKAAGLALSFTSFIPASVEAAKAGNYLYAYVIVINYSTLTFWTLKKLIEISFLDRRVAKVATAVVIAAASRLPVVALGLKLAPDMGNLWKTVLNGLGLTGLIGGVGALSTYKTLDNGSRLVNCTSLSEEEATVLRVKQTILNCIDGALIKGLSLPDSEREKEFSYLNLASEGSHPESIRSRTEQLFASLVKDGEYLRVREKLPPLVHRIGHVLFSPVTWAGSLALAVFNSSTTQKALSALFDTDSYWTWILGALSSGTILYTSYKKAPRAVRILIDSFVGLFTNHRRAQFADSQYPNVSRVCDLLAALQAGLIRSGGNPLGPSGSSATDGWTDAIYQEAAFMALFLLFYISFKELLIRPGIAFFAGKYGSDEKKQALYFFEVLTAIRDRLVNARISEVSEILMKLNLEATAQDTLLNGTSLLTYQGLAEVLRSLHNSSFKEIPIQEIP